MRHTLQQHMDDPRLRLEMPRTYQINSHLCLGVLTSDEREQREYMLALHTASGKWHQGSSFFFCAFSSLIFSPCAHHEDQPTKIMNIHHKHYNVQLLLEGACSAWPCRKCAYNSKHSRKKRQETASGL